LSLSFKNIKFGYQKDKLLLNDLSFDLQSGKIYTLMGGNGSGKTTLFNILTGFIKAESGDIRWNGQILTGLSPYKINRLGIGRTFQDLRIITKLTVLENIVLAMKENPTDRLLVAVLPKQSGIKLKNQFEQKAISIADRFFLDDVLNSQAGEISYGQQKLLTIACCVANGSDLLLLDEPAAGIQPEYRIKIGLLLKDLKLEGKTIFLIEHNTDFIQEVTDHLFFLTEGNILSFDTLEELKQNPIVMEAFF